MKYDDASYHSGGNYPKGLPLENAVTHMGMLMSWAIHKNLVSDMHKENSFKALDDVKQRKISGRKFVIDICDGKLTNEDFNEIGNDFLKDYYDKHYLKDYFLAVDPQDTAETAYSIEDSPENEEKVSSILEEKFQAWKKENKINTSL